MNPLNNQPITLYNIADSNKVGLADFLFTNIPRLDDNSYHAVEFTAQKRFTNRWQLLGGFTVQRAKGPYRRGLTDDFNNPNLDINRKNSILNLDATYVFKVDSTYEFPFRIATSVNFQHYTGYPLDPNLGPPQAVYDVGLNQGPVTVIAETRGRTRLPDVNILNLRLSRPIKLSERFTLEPLVDLFNLTNAHTITGAQTTFSADDTSNFKKPTDQVLNPFIARFGLKLTF